MHKEQGRVLMRFFAVVGCFFAVFALFAGDERAKTSMQAMIFDTDIHSVELYQHPISILKKLGWTVSYWPLQDSLKLGLDSVFKVQPALSIFIINDEFLRSGSSSIVGKFVKDALARSAAVRGGTTVVMIPALSTSKVRVAMRIAPLFKTLGLQSFVDEWAAESVGEFKKAMLHFLTNPFVRNPLQYHTALRLPQKVGPLAFKAASIYLENKQGDVLFSLPLPVQERLHLGGGVNSLLPFGTCFYSEERQHSFVVAYNSIMTTMGVAEDIHIFPFEVGLHSHFDAVANLFWSDIDLWQRYSNKPAKDDFIANVKKRFEENHAGSVVVAPISKVKKNPIKTAWMELVAFDETGKESRAEISHKRLQQQNLVISLFEARLEYVWISLSPQMYYGVHAKCPEKRGMFEAGFSRFAKMLKAESLRLKKPVPKVLIGFEIANNLYHENLPAEFAVDLYGLAYPDMPSPCSKRFWEDEVVQPLEAFNSFFIENKLQDFITLGGVAIDCELYGRLHASSFSPLMLCDRVLAAAFCQSIGRAEVPKNFIEWILSEHRLDSLIEFASRRVRECASSIKKAVNKLIPRGVIACYAPIVSIDWFLSNFCGALGAGEKPLQLFTFNTSFERIRPAVERKFGLSVKHSVVLMLSKFCGPQDYALLDRAMDGNDGYWFNRWSRFIEPRDSSAWHVIEQPRLYLSDECSAFYSCIAAH